MIVRAVSILLLAMPGVASAEPVAPEVKPPPTGTDVWRPLVPLPELDRPEVAWDTLLVGCVERKQGQSDRQWGSHVTIVTASAYDATGHLTKLVQDDTTTEYSWDAKGRLIKSVAHHTPKVATDAYTLTYEYIYEDHDRIARATKIEADAGRPELKNEMQFGYDAAGRWISLADADGTWRMKRSKTGVVIGLVVARAGGKIEVISDGTADAAGRLARVVEQDSEVRLSYDAAGHETKRVTKTKDGTETATLAYDAAGHVVKVEIERTGANARDEERTATYDAKGHMIASTRASHRGEWRAVDESSFTWDDKGHLVAETEKSSSGDHAHGSHKDSTTTYTYDAKGRLVKFSSQVTGYPPLDRTITTTYSYR